MSAGVKHAFRNVSAEGVSTLIVTTMAPARFLRQMGRPIADVLHRLEPVQHSQKRQVACGKNGTSAAILGKRRLLGERMLAVCNAGIWRRHLADVG